MRIGYVATANALPCRANHRFRLASYTEARLFDAVAANLECLEAILRFNVQHELRFFRISSDLVPFASHPICHADWAARFAPRFAFIGDIICGEGIRISMHPGQYTVLNSPEPELLARSVEELRYHARVLEALGLGRDAKIQIHVGGVYGDKRKAIATFCEAYKGLEDSLHGRLVIENDDRRFSLADCLEVHARVGVPVLLDVLHHACLGEGESTREALARAARTWGGDDGIPLVDYSSQQPGRPPGVHADTLDEADFLRFLAQIAGIECDVMLELRDKDRSALRAQHLAAALSRRS